jgi:long-chain fatty acid transport protein
MKKQLLAVSVASALVALAPRAHASAFALSEQGVSGLGNAYAGAAAVAEDASTVWWNPAGMSRLPRGSHLLVGGHLIVPKTEFNNRASVRGTGSNAARVGEGGDAGDATLVPNLFYALNMDSRWSFGVGVNVPFGLATEYDSDWIGRFQGIKSEVKTLNVNPSVSYKISDGASVGFGVNYQRGEIDLVQAVNFGALIPNAEGLNNTSVDGDAWGFNIGALFDIGPRTRLGIHYRSSLDYELDGSTSFSGVPAPLLANPAIAAGTATGSVKLDLETPATLSFSAAHRLNDRLELLGDITWTEWSKIDRLPLKRTSGPLAGTPNGTIDTLTFNFDDTWRVAVGANYKWNGPWTLRAGVAFDQSPVPNPETRSVRLPDNDRYWLSLGATYQISRSGRVDMGYTFVNIKDADINNNQQAGTFPKGIVNGTYEATVNILSVSYQHSF